MGQVPPVCTFPFAINSPIVFLHVPRCLSTKKSRRVSGAPGLTRDWGSFRSNSELAASLDLVALKPVREIHLTRPPLQVPFRSHIRICAPLAFVSSYGSAPLPSAPIHRCGAPGVDSRVANVGGHRAKSAPQMKIPNMRAADRRRNKEQRKTNKEEELSL